MRRRFMALTSAALALGGIAAAQVGLGLGRGYGLGFCWVAPEVLKQQLGLTDEQVKKLTELRTEHLNKVGKIVAELAAKQSELRTLWLSTQPDEKRIRELTEQVAKLRTELVTERANFWLEVRKILTPEQLSKLPTIRGRWVGPGLGLGFGLGPRWGGRGRRWGW